MNICCISLHLSASDTILVITALILLLTLIVIYCGIRENIKYNRLQSIKDTFFRMVEFHHNILNNIKVMKPKEGAIESHWVYGGEAFESMHKTLGEILGNIRIFHQFENEVDRIKFSFNSIYESNSQIGNYYKNLYLLIDYVNMKNEEKITGFDGNYYIKLIKTQLSKYEILMLAYNCIWIHGETEKEEDKVFLSYARRYNLLSALDISELLKEEHLSLLKDYK